MQQVSVEITENFSWLKWTLGIIGTVVGALIIGWINAKRRKQVLNRQKH